jgi:hypothetical protein
MQIILWNVVEWILIGLLAVFALVLVFAIGSLVRILFEVGRAVWWAGQEWFLRRRASSWWRS